MSEFTVAENLAFTARLRLSLVHYCTHSSQYSVDDGVGR